MRGIRMHQRLLTSYSSLVFHKRLPVRQCRPALCLCLQNRPLSTSAEPIPEPYVEGTEKDYSPKIEEIVDRIGGLTLLEVADLNELLKKKLNISEAPMMMGAMPGMVQAQAAEEDDAPTKVEKSMFTATLTKFDDTKKVAIIKEIKNLLEGMNLVQAKKFVEGVPQDIKVDIVKDEAEKLKAALEAVGGTVEIS